MMSGIGSGTRSRWKESGVFPLDRFAPQLELLYFHEVQLLLELPRRPEIACAVLDLLEQPADFIRDAGHGSTRLARGDTWR